MLINKTLKLHCYDETFDVCFYLNRYEHHDNLYVGLYCIEEGGFEPFCDITVNLDEKVPEEHGYLDTNNMGSEMVDWLKANDFISLPLSFGFSGYCVYPLVKFNMDKIKEYIAEIEE